MAQKFAILLILFITTKVLCIMLEKYEYCTDYEIKLNIIPGKVLPNGNQLISVNYATDIEIGTNTKLIVNVQIPKDNKWIQLIKAPHTKGACDFYTKFGGEMWYDLERALNLTPKACPLKPGSYSCVDFELNFNRLKLPKVQKGKIRLEWTILEKKTGKVLMCPVFYLII